MIFSAIYLIAPSSIMYSQIIKPNWYALLWFNLSIFYGLKYIINKKKNFYFLLTSIFLGLTIGSSILFAPAVFFIFILIFLNLKKTIPKNYFLFLIFSTLAIFFLTNPYILTNFTNFFNESRGEYNWVLKGININKHFIDTRKLLDYKIPEYEDMISEMINMNPATYVAHNCQSLAGATRD